MSVFVAPLLKARKRYETTLKPRPPRFSHFLLQRQFWTHLQREPHSPAPMESGSLGSLAVWAPTSGWKPWDPPRKPRCLTSPSLWELSGVPGNQYLTLEYPHVNASKTFFFFKPPGTY